jgi:hypothetical protein
LQGTALPAEELLVFKERLCSIVVVMKGTDRVVALYVTNEYEFYWTKSCYLFSPFRNYSKSRVHWQENQMKLFLLQERAKDGNTKDYLFMDIKGSPFTRKKFSDQKYLCQYRCCSVAYGCLLRNFEIHVQ